MAAAGRSASADSTGAAPTVTLGGAAVRPPSIPLAVRSPYLSSWLPATTLTATRPQFWNGNARGFVGLVMIDGQVYAWAGQPVLSNNSAVPALTAVSTEVTSTRSIFTGAAAGVELVVEWLSPVEPGNLQLQSAPLTLLTVSVSFTDGNSHDVAIYADITGEWASSDESALIEWQTTADSSGRYWTVGLQSPASLTETSQMANWGQVVWATPSGQSPMYQSGDAVTVRSQFASSGTLENTSDPDSRAIDDNQPAFALAVDLGSSAGSASFVLGHVRTPLIGYGPSATPLLPLWTNYWSGWQQMTAAFISGAASARQRSVTLDDRVQTEATAAGGPGYAAACALALRQCYGGTELAIGPDGNPWLLGKEISSDGDINTVDIFDQAFLAWLWLDPELIPLVMTPILNWCASDAWQSPAAWQVVGSDPSRYYYCVHDLGVYPNATGHVPGDGEQMPIEESAGMLIMAAAYARAVGSSAARPFLSQWQQLWSQWATYLMTQAPTPDTQKSTDDWAPGYVPVIASVNLGLKAMIGLIAASQIATILGDETDAATWSAAATDNVASWISLSTDSTTGNHLNLQQGKTGTWSSLYNAYYELVLGISLVPDQIAANQATFYMGELTTYGMPLETNTNLTKTAWLFYLPAWLSDYPIADELMSRNVAYINDTPSLVPYGDRYDTTNATEVTGIQAHPTLGAVFALLAPANAWADSGASPGSGGGQAATPMAVQVTASAGPKPMLTIYLSSGGLKLSGETVGVRVHGPKGVSCRGSLKLVYTREVVVKHRKAKRESTVIGHASYSLPAGGSHTVKIKLTAVGLKLLRNAKHRRLSVVISATVKGGKSTSKRTTLHAAGGG